MRGMIWDRQYLSGWLSFGSGHISRVSPVFELTTRGDFSPKIPSGKYDQTYIKKNENSILDFHVKQTSSGGWLSTWRLIILKKLRKTVKLILDYSKGAKLSISIPSQSLEGEASEGSFQDFLSFVKRSSKPFFFIIFRAAAPRSIWYSVYDCGNRNRVILAALRNQSPSESFDYILKTKEKTLFVKPTEESTVSSWFSLYCLLKGICDCEVYLSSAPHTHTDTLTHFKPISSQSSRLHCFISRLWNGS